MKDKEGDYYVPEIEEFHHGFVYEMIPPIGYTFLDFNDLKKQVETVWSNQYIEGVYNVKPVSLFGSELANIKGAIAENKCRVKYLDREDIESFGFELDQCTKDGCVFYKGHLITKEEWCLTFGGKTNPKNYLSVTSMKNNPNSFTGVVKNKSELKIILKQLGIWHSK